MVVEKEEDLGIEIIHKIFTMIIALHQMEVILIPVSPKNLRERRL